MQEFQEALHHCGLTDLPTVGSKFTWANNRHRQNFTKEKLDRAMANQALLNFPIDICCAILPVIKSDQAPLLTKVKSKNVFRAKRPYIFQYEMFWEVRDECYNIIREVQNRDQNLIQIKLLNCKVELIKWRKAVKREVDAGKEDLAL